MDDITSFDHALKWVKDSEAKDVTQESNTIWFIVFGLGCLIMVGLVIWLIITLIKKKPNTPTIVMDMKEEDKGVAPVKASSPVKATGVSTTSPVKGGVTVGEADTSSSSSESTATADN